MDGSTGMVVSSAIVSGTAVAKDFLGRVFGPVGDEVGLDLRDWYARLRGRGIETVVARAHEMQLTAGVEPTRVDAKRLVAILDGASLEEDPELQERWAALLANAASEADTAKVHPAFGRILGELTAFDARVLEVVSRGTTPPGEQPRATARQRIALFVGQPDRERVDVALDNLERVGVLTVGHHAEWGGIPGLAGNDDMIVTTAFGEQFLSACRAPQAME